MKNLKRVLAVVLCLIMTMSIFAIGASAEDETYTLSILNYNVAGLPIDIDVQIGRAHV